MKIYLLHNLKSKIDPGGTLSKNLSDRLVKLMRELAKLVTNINSKVQEQRPMMRQ